MNRPLVIGIGSHSGDDQAGWLVVDRLKELGYPEVHLRKAPNPAAILNLIGQCRSLVICDACRGTSSAGTTHSWRWPCHQLGYLSSRGTHDMGLGEVLEVAEALGMKPTSIQIRAVEGEAWSPSTEASVIVRQGADRVAWSIWEESNHA